MAAVGIKGGDLLDNRLRELAKRVSNPAVLRVGFLENATYPDGTSVAQVAAIQNFGAPSRRIPARAFFSRMVREYGPEWGAKLGRLLIANDWDAERALELMGAGIAGQLRQSIVATMEPPLSAITLMLRHMKHENPDLQITGAIVGEAAARVAAGESSGGVSTKPLVDTGHMLASVDSEVTTRG